MAGPRLPSPALALSWAAGCQGRVSVSRHGVLADLSGVREDRCREAGGTLVGCCCGVFHLRPCLVNDWWTSGSLWGF